MFSRTIRRKTHRVGKRRWCGVEESQVEGCEQLNTIDQSAFFLVLIIFGTLLSYRVLALGRTQLCLALDGETEKAEALTGPAFRMRCATSALVTGALGFFLVTAQRVFAQAAEGEDEAACRSAGRNLWASLLVFAAALIRLYDLNAVKREQQSLNETELVTEELPA